MLKLFVSYPLLTRLTGRPADVSDFLSGGTRAAWIASLVLVSVAFGMGHIDQGVTGMTENVINGLLLGLIYLAFDRNLAVPIVAHGVSNTVDLLLIYLGKYTGL